LICLYLIVGGGDTPGWCGTSVLAEQIIGGVRRGFAAFGGAGIRSKKVELFVAIRFDWQRNQVSARTGGNSFSSS
jgi:hypothetical protein